MLLTMTVPPTLRPLTLDDCKAHLRIGAAQIDDDGLIQAQLDAAIGDCEALCHRAIMSQTWQARFDCFECELPLRRPTVTEVTAVEYIDATTGTLQTLASTGWQACGMGHPMLSSVRPAYGLAWPSARAQAEAVRVTFVTGWASAALVPAPIKQWILLRLASYYELRQGWTERRIEPNDFIDGMLAPWRVPVL